MSKLRVAFRNLRTVLVNRISDGQKWWDHSLHMFQQFPSVIPESLLLHSSHSFLYSFNINFTIKFLTLIAGTPSEKQEPSPISELIRCFLPEIYIRKEVLSLFLYSGDKLYLDVSVFQQRSIFVFTNHNKAPPLPLYDQIQKPFRQKLKNISLKYVWGLMRTKLHYWNMKLVSVLL